jgi:hypothetical protein
MIYVEEVGGGGIFWTPAPDNYVSMLPHKPDFCWSTGCQLPRPLRLAEIYRGL